MDKPSPTGLLLRKCEEMWVRACVCVGEEIGTDQKV